MMKRGLLWTSFLLAMNACGGDAEVPDNPDAGGGPTGALEVRWAVQDTRGEPIDCDAAGFTDAEIAIGGAPLRVPCGQGSVLFEDLLPQRYPVFVRLRVATVVVREEALNAQVEAGQTAVVDVVFEVTADADRIGDLKVRWVVGGRAAADGCAALGGTAVRVLSGPASAGMFDQTAPCMDGETTVQDLPTGGYEVILDLIDAGGQVVTSNTVPGINVRGGQTAETERVDLFVPNRNPATMRAEWTVSGTTAAAGCAELGAVSADLSLLQDARVLTSTSCRQGYAELEGLRQSNDVGIQLVLFGAEDPVSGVRNAITSTVVRRLRLEQGRTTTVSVDLESIE